jgi:hypothetical protein
MKIKKNLYFLIVFISFSCGQKTTNEQIISKREFAMKSYIKHIDSLLLSKTDFYDLDSTDYNYKFLKGYFKNDTNYLGEVIRVLNDPNNKNPELDSFWEANIPILKNMKIEEGYQFQYSETFCSDYYILTITKAKNLIKLSSIIYRPTMTDNNKPIKLKIKSNFQKVLTESNWNELIKDLDYADYWNLKSKNNDLILDPSNLTILGIKKNITEMSSKTEKTNSVSRTIFRETAIYKSFLTILKLAEIEKLCKD